MFIFLIYSLFSCWGNISNSKVTRNLHNYIAFYHKMLGGQKMSCLSLSKSWGDMSPVPHKLGPCFQDVSLDILVHTNFMSIVIICYNS